MWVADEPPSLALPPLILLMSLAFSVWVCYWQNENGKGNDIACSRLSPRTGNGEEVLSFELKEAWAFLVRASFFVCGLQMNPHPWPFPL